MNKCNKCGEPIVIMNKCNKCGEPIDEYEAEYNERLCYKCYTISLYPLGEAPKQMIEGMDNGVNDWQYSRPLPQKPKPELVLECCGKPESECRCDELKPYCHQQPTGKPLGCKRGFCDNCEFHPQPEPDERLLTDNEEFVDYEVEYCELHHLHFPLSGEARDICNREAQLAKDLKWEARREAEFVTEKAEFGLSVNETAYKQGKADCQTRVERIFKKITRHFETRGYRDIEELNWWQALKKRERVK